MKEKHRQALEKKNATIALLNDDLKNCDMRTWAYSFR